MRKTKLCKRGHIKDTKVYLKDGDCYTCRKERQKLRQRKIKGRSLYASTRYKKDPSITYITSKCDICNDEFFPKRATNIRCPSCSSIARNTVHARISNNNYNSSKNRNKRQKISTKSVSDITRSFIHTTECVYCNRTFNEYITKSFDHITPYHMGGNSESDNIAICCKQCNSSKAGLPLEEWIDLCACVVVHARKSVH